MPPARGTRYVLDTRYYVGVLRGAAEGAAVTQWLASGVAAVDFHVVVGAELLFGAAGARGAAAIRQRLVDRFKPERLLVPDAADLLATGDAVRQLRARDGDHPEHGRRNFWNDVIVAVSCRRRGRTLISRDADHARIKVVVGHRVLLALPSAAAR